jgi:hypothetical protein
MNQGRRPISLLSFLQAENARLREVVAELSLDTTVLREILARELARKQSTKPDANFRPPDRHLACSRGETLGQDANHAVSK